MIVVTAVLHGLTVVTGNIRAFRPGGADTRPVSDAVRGTGGGATGGAASATVDRTVAMPLTGDFRETVKAKTVRASLAPAEGAR